MSDDAARPLPEALRQLEASLRQDGNPVLADEALVLSHKLRENIFQVVVMGEFKRGKSTLINALIGRSLMPVAAVPLTSVVTVVRHGDETRAFVEFQDGHRRETAVGSIAEFISEERNPRNEKRVARVAVETPALFLKGGTLLVDTPGAGSVYRHNTEVAQRYMPEADAVILVLAADPPISQNEVEFLHSVRRWARKLFIVQNKIDYLEPADLEKSLAFTQKALRAALGEHGAPLFPVSAKLALQGKMDNDAEKLAASGLLALDETLARFLSSEKGSALEESVRARAIALIDRGVLQIDLRLRQSHASTDEWQALAGKLRARLEEAKHREFELTTLYSAELKRHENTVEERLYARIRELSAEVKAALDSFYRSIRAEPAASVREKLNEALMRHLEDAFSSLLGNDEPAWNAGFETITDRYLASTVALVNDTLRESAKALDIPAAVIAKPRLAIPAPSVWFVVEKVSVWSGGIGSVPTVRVFKPFFWRAVQRKIGEAMDLNAGRLRYDYSVRLERAGAQASSAIHEFFELCLAGVRDAVAASDQRQAGAVSRQEFDSASLARQRMASCRSEGFAR